MNEEEVPNVAESTPATDAAVEATASIADSSAEVADAAGEVAEAASDVAEAAEETSALAIDTVDSVEEATEKIEEVYQSLISIDWSAVLGKAVGIAIQIAIALAVFYIGRFVARRITRMMKAAMTKREVDPLLINFAASIVFYGLMVVVVISALGQLGIRTTSLVAVLGAAGLAVGLALQGSLSNFASGVLIILFRPFKVGDFITAGGESGIVDMVTILTTELKTLDNKKIIIPNSSVMGGAITNVTAYPIRRVDLTFGISYDDDIDKARDLIWEVLKADERILDEPETQVKLAELGDSSVNFVVRPWVNKEDWWGVFTDVQEKVKKTFDANGITIPYPQRDVHLYQKTGASST